MLVRRTLKITPRARTALTPERIAEIEARAPRDEDIVFDEDCPEMTEEQLSKFQRVHPLPGKDAPASERRYG